MKECDDTVVNGKLQHQQLESSWRQSSSCANPRSAGAGDRLTTKEMGGELGPPRHELKPDNEPPTRFHRHKALGKPAAVGLVN